MHKEAQSDIYIFIILKTISHTLFASLYVFQTCVCDSKHEL